MDYEKLSVFEQIKLGLEQAVAGRRGRITLRTVERISSAPKFGKRRIVALRKKAGMSQGVLALYLNVPKRTVESWEQGLRVPKSGAARLLQLLEADPEGFREMVSRAGDEPVRRRKAG